MFAMAHSARLDARRTVEIASTRSTSPHRRHRAKELRQIFFWEVLRV
jgi:hypothetical protein